MKILVTGANGMLGTALTKELTGHQVFGLNSSQLNILDSLQVESRINEIKPDIIIHAAAYTDVEAAEENKGKAFLVNALGTQNIANCCVGKKILFIYISSTGIYGEAKSSSYNEYDSVAPTTIHHKSKHEAELIVRNHLNRYLIIRTGWLFGGEKEHSKNFVYKRYLEARNKNVIYSDDSQIGNPTYTKALAQQIQVLIESNQFGVFNCVNDAVNVTRFDYVKKIVSLFGLECQVKKAEKMMFERIAPVSKNESAVNYKLNLLGLNVMPRWDESLTEYISQLKLKV